MSKFQCHYESLKVTRDAPAEVIRAAYRSLSQKHHPDKNIGNPDAAMVMARLNSAYSVLSDVEQRRLYDLQILRGQRAFWESVDAGDAGHAAAPAGKADRTGSAASDFANGRATHRGGSSLLARLRFYATNRSGQIGIMVLGVVVLALAMIFSLVRKEQQATLLLQQAAIYAADRRGPAAPATPLDEAPGTAAATAPSGSEAFQLAPAAGSQAATPALPPKAPEAPGPAPKASEFERLTAMLKNMGLGLHKLDLSTPPPTAKRPPMPASAAEGERAAVAPGAASAPSPRMAATAPVPPETARAREESERPPAPDPVRAETKAASEAIRAGAPAAGLVPATSAATTSPAARYPVVVDTRACAPTYPANAYSNGDSGTVQLALLVGVEGRVIESKVLKSSGHPELDKAARRALSQCKFKFPGNEKPVEPAWANLEYVFSLD